MTAEDELAIANLLSRLTITDEALKGEPRIEITIPGPTGCANLINVSAPPTTEQLADLAEHLPVAPHLREHVIARLFAPPAAD